MKQTHTIAALEVLRFSWGGGEGRSCGNTSAVPWSQLPLDTVPWRAGIGV